MKMDLKDTVLLEESGDQDVSCSWKNGKGRPLEDISNIPEGKKDQSISLKKYAQEPKSLFLKI